MKKQNILLGIIIIVTLSILGIIYYIFNNEDTNSTLTLVEKQWIESNKNNIIDFGLINNVSILNNAGEGIVFDFITSIEEDTGIEFNKVSYNYGDKIEESYSLKVVKEISDNDILVYTDNYVIVGKENIKYNNLDQLKSSNVGVIDNNIDVINKYLPIDGISFQGYSTVETLLNSFNSDDSTIDYIVLPKLVFLSNYENNTNLYINYNISEIEDNYVIELGKTKILNNILKKYYKKWSSENFETKYASEFTNLYFNISSSLEQEKVKFRSKRYLYGFTENAPFDIEVNGKLVGINSSILKSFSDIANIEITFQEYSSISKLKSAFKNGDIDLYFNKYTDEKYDLDVYNTVSFYDEQVVILSNYEENLIINSVNSLDKLTIVTLKDTKIENELKKLGVTVKSYDKMNDLLSKANKHEIIAIDKSTYEFYKKLVFSDYKIDFQFSLENNYNYIIRDIKNNEVFSNFINFYLTFINEKPLINKGYYNAISANSKDNLIKNIVTAIGLFVVLVFAFLLGSRFMPNRVKTKKVIMKKEDKLKYVDMLTSLKNRNYLNDNIENWDASEIYPQSIIIADLNNIAYINDNYGHQEGDEIIRQAANILIKNQIPNSDIIRTNGNEFLIYLATYDEKQVLAYIKKLNKEFKELAHGFGAAIGYSMITDGIKTIDDAVNEATLDMRNNKEELNNN